VANVGSPPIIVDERRPGIRRFFLSRFGLFFLACPAHEIVYGRPASLPLLFWAVEYQ